MSDAAKSETARDLDASVRAWLDASWYPAL